MHIDKKLVEVPFDSDAREFVEKHLSFNRDEFWWIIWASWLVGGWGFSWLIPLFRWAHDVQSVTKLAITVMILLSLLVLSLFVSWIARRINLLLDRRSGKLREYHGSLTIKRIGRAKREMIGMEDVTGTGPFWNHNMAIPVETDFKLPESGSGTLGYLYYSQLPYQLNGRLVEQTRFCPFRLSVNQILMFFWMLGVTISALYVTPWIALIITAVSYFTIERVLGIEEPESIAFWQYELSKSQSTSTTDS